VRAIRKECRYIACKKSNGIMINNEDEFKVLFLVYVLYVVRFLVEVCLG
jgi:hypothetical protein